MFTPVTVGSGLQSYEVPLPDGSPRSLVWSRYPGPLPDDPRIHACALAYITDTSAMDAIGASHPHGIPTPEEKRTTFMTASLDHAVWFHRPTRADDWVLLDLDGHGIIRTRGLSTGHAFSADGQHVATIAQEGLIRELTTPRAPRP
jgi:acyl-CoA thioesterase-2